MFYYYDNVSYIVKYASVYFYKIFSIFLTFEGFPVPDFDFDDDTGPSYGDVEVSNITVTPEDDETLCRKNGLIIKPRSPLRCTSNSMVFLAKSIDGSQSFAAKITPHKGRVRDEYNKRLQIPDSPYLVKTLNLFESDSKALLLMELCEQGDLSMYDFQEKEVVQLINNIGNALSILHENNWMHLDVSPGNILLTSETFKLADFGTLVKKGEFEEGCEGAGPFVSPEALAFPGGKFPVTPATDIFSFGVVLLETASGRHAPRGGSLGYGKLRSGELYLGCSQYPCNFNPDLIKLINSMLSPNPYDRPTASDLVRVTS